MYDVTHQSPINRHRRAGVLLHPTSLPGPYLNGDIGHQAYRFIEFLKDAGFKVWQMLPLGPTHEDKSPYQCLSSHAGNPQLISLDWLEDKGWLDRSKITSTERSESYRADCLNSAADYFYSMSGSPWHRRLEEFKQEHVVWLEDYALFIAIKTRFDNQPWYDWPDEFRQHQEKALGRVKAEQQQVIAQVEFEQFIFFTQWHEIRDYARRHDIELFGDVPIFVAKDSADVWAKRENFLIDENGKMEVIAGVPPDAFSDTGQRWGNPLYDWKFMQNEGFAWWQERFTTQLELFDMVRIDHFRGLQACWQIPASDDTAINGKWVEVPGAALLSMLHETFENLPLVAEDLGVITDEVIALKNAFMLPGMKVLQFAFDGNPANTHLPHLHHTNDIVYTGTHDNDTTLGWFKQKQNYNRQYLDSYLGHTVQTDEEGLLNMIRLAFGSVSFLSMLPMQDILLLDSSARMNMPGTLGGNWQWRFEWKQIKQDKLDSIKKLLSLFQR